MIVSRLKKCEILKLNGWDSGVSDKDPNLTFKQT